MMGYMFRRFTRLIIYCVLAPLLSHAQVLPRENSILNYRLVGFAFDEKRNGKYIVEVAEGYYNNADSFVRHIIAVFPCETNRVIGEVPAFGREYTWRYRQVKRRKGAEKLFHFSTALAASADTSVTRLRILKTAEKHKDDFVFMDGTKALYDMNGRPVWFLSRIDGDPAATYKLGDMKVTPQGTITFLSGRRNAMIFETDYNGTVLWKGPDSAGISGERTEHYNHEFTRLKNGHYMVLGYEQALWKLPATADSGVISDITNNKKITRDGQSFLQKLCFYTIIELDEKKRVVWALRTNRYFSEGADTLLRITRHGVYDDDELLVNSFYCDEDNKVLYLSFRNLGRIFKVGYPDGKLLGVYGNIDKRRSDAEKDLFCWQHSCRRSPGGYIYLFNNNICHPNGLPKITVIEDTEPDRGAAKKIWEYECVIDGITPETRGKYIFSNGGSVDELADSSMFVCMSNQYYTNVFIVNRSKEIIWSGVCEARDAGTHKWQAINQYKASIVTRKELEQMIWRAMPAVAGD